MPRFSVTSSQGFHDMVAAFEAAIGHPDMNSFSKNVGAKIAIRIEQLNLVAEIKDAGKGIPLHKQLELSSGRKCAWDFEVCESD